MKKKEICYCKHCFTTFQVEINQFENRALLLECSNCKWPHARQFEAGTAIHCDIGKMNNPILIKAIQ